MTEGIEIVVIEHPSDADRAAVLEPLRKFNEAQAGPANMLPVAILIEDATGNPVGGLWGHTSYDWMFIQLLAVPEDYRGRDLGTRLMEQAEAEARKRGCIGVWLDTYSFQASGFYKKLGYSQFGCIDDYPSGHQRFFFSKRL